jgi:hypothetical protein
MCVLLSLAASCSNIPDYKKDAKLSWHALGSGIEITDMVNHRVEALHVDSSGVLYASGYFVKADGVTVNNITQWNGSSWTALSTGTDGAIAGCLNSDSGGNLYAGGYYNLIGGVVTNKIARWNGSAWSSLAGGAQPSGTCWVNAICSDNSGAIYAGGSFTTIGGVSAAKIAKWDGASWSAVGTGVGMDASVVALYRDNSGNMYAGGTFTSVDGIPASCIAKWNGISWSAMGSGMNASVNALCSDSNGNIYAGGTFTTADGNTAMRIARWNGSSWIALGSGMNGNVNALCSDDNGNIYAGGTFTTAGGVAVNKIAKWDGSTWSALGSGMSSIGRTNYNVNALCSDKAGNIYAGGYFTHAGGVQVNCIARWGY